MKKLVLATAILAASAAGTASAATIYENNGLTYKLKGDFQIQLRQDVGDDQNLDVEFDDLELKNSVVYDLGNGMKAFGQLDFGYKNDAEGKSSGSHLEEAYVGLDFGNVAVSIGQQNHATDDFGVYAAYEASLSEDAFDAQGTSGNDVIRADVNLGSLNLIATTELDAEGENSEDGESFDLLVSTELQGVELAAAYQTMKTDVNADSVDTFGVSAMADLGIAKIGADYSSTDDVQDQINLVAKMGVAQSTQIAVGLNNVDPEQGDDVTEWYANVTYKFPQQKNVSVFAEIADTDEDNVDLGYLAGLRVKF
ncbi:porin [Oceanospirillum beijerinckii]|uniref:porin n=1 Tax=Oceanospirillum beijerinckii TaxID=64976 RepID=UPI00040A5055|nr:porin [Oceanospirillum beijerinckii]